MYRRINGKVYWCVEVPSKFVNDECPKPPGPEPDPWPNPPWCDPPEPNKVSNIVINFYDDDPGGTAHGGADPSDPKDPIEPSPDPNPAEPDSPEKFSGKVVINYYAKR
ncbi:hypothetical protein MHB67_04345 [Bacillus sp. FSL H8-0516]|uniref:hypothetical protein n=1 Tax=Bacillus sp. FSL H8-0516 TaxID=2921397 RepID=UPI00315B2209